MELFAALGAFILLIAGTIELRRWRYRTIRERMSGLNPGAYRAIPVSVWCARDAEGQAAGGVGLIFMGPKDGILGWRRVDPLGFFHWTKSRLRWDSIRLEPHSAVTVTLVAFAGEWWLGIKDGVHDVEIRPAGVSRAERRSASRLLEIRSEIRALLGREPAQLAVGELGSAARWLVRFVVMLAVSVLLCLCAIGSGEPAAVATCAVLAVAVFALQLLGRRRTGRVEFYAHTIEFLRQETRTVFYRELAGYRDDSSDFVQLVRDGAFGASPELAVPTRTEEERVAVLRLLDARGLKRIER